MTTRHADTSNEWFSLRTSGWIVSLCLHGSIIFLSGLLLAKVVAPPSSPFHWDVTVVDSQLAAPISATPAAPTVFPKNIRSSFRHTPSNAAKEKRSVSPPPASQALPAPTDTIDSRTADPVVTPLSSESPRTLEPTTAVPLHEKHRLESDQSLLPQASLLPSDTSTPLHSQQAVVPSGTGDSPASDPLPPSPGPPITQQATSAPPQVASLPSPSLSTPESHKPDYGWLAGPLLQRIETLKEYPASARLNHQEGRVIVRIVIEEDGRITSATIATSSGHAVLDQAALNTLRQASPVVLSRPLEKSPLTIQIPLNYRLGG